MDSILFFLDDSSQTTFSVVNETTSEHNPISPRPWVTVAIMLLANTLALTLMWWTLGTLDAVMIMGTVLLNALFLLTLRLFRSSPETGYVGVGISMVSLVAMSMILLPLIG